MDDAWSAVVRGLMQGQMPEGVRMQRDLARRNARLRLAAARLRYMIWDGDDVVRRYAAGTGTPPPLVIEPGDAGSGW